MMWSGYLTEHTAGVVTVEAEDRDGALALAQLIRPDVTGVARTTCVLREEARADHEDHLNVCNSAILRHLGWWR